MGDGVLIEFASAVDAVQCAVELQKNFAEANARRTRSTAALRLRMGINLGDVIVEGGTISTVTGSNIAARLEKLAEPGGICVSAQRLRSGQGQARLSIHTDLGEQRLNNIPEPVRVYRVRMKRQASSASAAWRCPTNPRSQSCRFRT